jgi:tetratricopeptide (TPR) repeat protein
MTSNGENMVSRKSGTSLSVAAGRDIRDSVISVGLPAHEVERAIKEAQAPVVERLETLAAAIAQDKGIPAAPLRAILAKLGEAGVLDCDIPAKLDAAADELIALRIQLGRLDANNPELRAIRSAALQAIDRGELDLAKETLERGRLSARSCRSEAALLEATFLAEQAKIDHMELAYSRAAGRYREAARCVEPFDRDQQAAYVLAEADEFEAWGREFGDNAALKRAVRRYRAAAKLSRRVGTQQLWILAKIGEGIAEATLGERERINSRLIQAIRVYRSTLRVIDRKTSPLIWGRIYNYLGNAQKALGERRPSEGYLEEAAESLSLALEERTRTRAPLDWASTQNNLGTIYQALGERDTEVDFFYQAEACYRAALEERTRVRVPFLWANTIDNLGVALVSIGTAANSGSALQEAVSSHEEALSVRTRGRVPLLWGRSLHNLGEAFRALGQRENHDRSLRKAVRAFRLALRERTRERVPVQWANTWHELGVTLALLIERRRRLCGVPVAVSAFERALEVRTGEKFPVQAEQTRTARLRILELASAKKTDRSTRPAR